MKIFGRCIHRYKIAFVAGANTYLECKCCGHRTYRGGSGYSAIDRDWLNNSKNS